MCHLVIADTASQVTSSLPSLLAAAGFSLLALVSAAMGVSYSRRIRPVRGWIQPSLRGRFSKSFTLQRAFENNLKENTAETVQTLAQIDNIQAEAIRRLIDTALRETSHQSRRDSIWIAVASFIAGSSVTVAVTLFVHPIH